MNTNNSKNLNQFLNYDLLIISDCLTNSRFIQNYNLDIPLFIIYFKQSNFHSDIKSSYLVYNSNTTYLTVLEKISEFTKNP